MMTRKYTASEVIRIVALKILAQHPQGLSFSTLKSFTEQELEKYIEPDDYNKGKYRSALWNLDKVKQGYVLRTDAEGDKRFHPTMTLLAEVNDLQLPDMEEFIRIQREKEAIKTSRVIRETSTGYEDRAREHFYRSMQPWQKISHIRSILENVNDYIDEKQLRRFINRIILDPSGLSHEEIEAVYRLKFCLDMLNEHKTTIFRNKF
ncbi:hypothetical protein [Brevibacillus porteri]|uniref:hypothetical protein n=1 Tax=Brevibacillus porteri TaxID=2126350 RepID=UPI00362B6FE2